MTLGSKDYPRRKVRAETEGLDATPDEHEAMAEQLTRHGRYDLPERLAGKRDQWQARIAGMRERGKRRANRG